MDRLDWGISTHPAAIDPIFSTNTITDEAGQVDYPTGHGLQGDVIRVYNYSRCVRDQ